MHTNGYSHDDLKLENLVFGCNDTKRRLYLIDLDHCSKAPQFTVLTSASGESLSDVKLSPKMLTSQSDHFGKDFGDLKTLFRSIRTSKIAFTMMRQNKMLKNRSAIDPKIKKLIKIVTYDKVSDFVKRIFDVLDALKKNGIYKSYTKLDELTDDLCKLLNLDEDFPLDWEPGGVYYNTFDKLRLKFMFREV
uniref:Protein kinase domain-containing protein n=1 Tax=Romanomermis culicivorax TaxID=13658 RepID=A0A915HEJ2_ROMCU